MILAIDPGTTQSAYVLWDGARVRSAEILPNDLMNLLVDGSAQLGNVETLVIEQIASMGMAVGKEVFETCVWTGRFMQSWLSEREDGFRRIPRLEIKVHLCGSARAKDANIRQALIDRFGIVGTKKNPGPLYGVKSHIWSALAVAVVQFDRMKAGMQ